MGAMTPTSSTGGPSGVSGPSEVPGPDTAADGGPYWYNADKAALLGRLRRIEGQIRGLHRMVDEDAYCIDILTQISAATRALQAVAVGLLEGHLAHCVVQAARDGDPAAKVKEASEAIARLVRS
jgi:CsoR family transcriptional regulator, copper-sensing transcriptional repressor